MATTVAPIELPTSRRSYYNTSTPIDIHDPNWIPVLDSSAYKPPLSPTEKEVFAHPTATFSLFPTSTSSPKPQQTTFSHNYSKSSLAPESVTSGSDSRSQSPQDNVEPLPAIPTSFQSSQDGDKGHNRQMTATTAASSEEKISVGTEAQGSTEESESANAVEERAPSGMSLQHDHVLESAVNPSMRSSMVSTKKNAVLPPTSKYNRKPVASIASTTMGRPAFISTSAPQTPHDSPRLGASVPAALASMAAIQPLPSPKLPPFEMAQPPEPPSRLQAMKSTASERRQRALHSHPSNVSLRSQRNSISDDAEIVPKVPSIRKSRKSTDSRATTPRSTIFDGQIPTPAPTTPLPDLPPEAHIQARRPSTREAPSQRNTQSPAEEPLPATPSQFQRPFEHARVASFMTEKNTIVLRRFDDVHARLLLCLQDEIAQLEKELEKLENPNSPGSPSEKILAKSRILRELRKVVAEYGKCAEKCVFHWIAIQITNQTPSHQITSSTHGVRCKPTKSATRPPKNSNNGSRGPAPPQRAKTTPNTICNGSTTPKT